MFINYIFSCIPTFDYGTFNAVGNDEINLLQNARKETSR